MGYGFGNRIAVGKSPVISQIIAPPAPSGFPDTATTNVVNALINDSDETITAFLQNVGYTAVNNVFTVPMTKVNPPSQIYYSVEYKTTFYEDAYIQLIHSNAVNRWFFSLIDYGNLIYISTPSQTSNSTIPAARSSYSGTNINSMVSPNCFS